MKIRAFTLLSLLSTGILCAQEVVSTQGESLFNVLGSIDFTLGEVIISTETDGGSIITQGFHLGVVNFNAEQEVIIFPNPASDLVFIRIKAFEDVTYTLYDLQGKLVMYDILTSSQTPLQLSDLASGTYLLNVKKNAENLHISKITVIH